MDNDHDPHFAAKRRILGARRPASTGILAPHDVSREHANEKNKPNPHEKFSREKTLVCNRSQKQHVFPKITFLSPTPPLLPLTARVFVVLASKVIIAGVTAAMVGKKSAVLGLRPVSALLGLLAASRVLGIAVGDHARRLAPAQQHHRALQTGSNIVWIDPLEITPTELQVNSSVQWYRAGSVWGVGTPAIVLSRALPSLSLSLGRLMVRCFARFCLGDRDRAISLSSLWHVHEQVFSGRTMCLGVSLLVPTRVPCL